MNARYAAGNERMHHGSVMACKRQYRSWCSLRSNHQATALMRHFGMDPAPIFPELSAVFAEECLKPSPPPPPCLPSCQHGAQDTCSHSKHARVCGTYFVPLCACARRCSGGYVQRGSKRNKNMIKLNHTADTRCSLYTSHARQFVEDSRSHSASSLSVCCRRKRITGQRHVQG